MPPTVVPTRPRSVLPDGPSSDPVVRDPKRPVEWRDPALDFPWAALLGLLHGPPGPGSVNSTANSRGGGLIGAAAPGEFIPVVYGGPRLVQGSVIYQEIGNLTEANFAIVVCEGEIESFEKIYIDDVELPSLPNVGISYYRGLSGGEHDGWLDRVVPSNDGFPNTAWCRIHVGSPGGVNHPWWESLPVSAQNAAKGGGVKFSFLIKGKKCFDTRAATTVWTRNPVICLRDFITSTRYGGHLDSARVSDTSWEAGADIADAVIGSSPRFVCDLVIARQQGVRAWSDSMRMLCNAEFYPADDGKIGLFVDVENAGSPVLELDHKTNLSEIQYSYVSAKEQPTRVYVSFPSALIKDKIDTTPPIDHPGIALGTVPVREARYTVEGCPDMVHGLRIGVFVVNFRAITLRLDAKGSFDSNLLTRGSKVTITSAKGLVAAEFLHIDQEVGSSGIPTVHLRPYDEDIYGDSAIIPTDPILSPPPNPYAVPEDLPEVGGTPRTIEVVDPRRGAIRWERSHAAIEHTTPDPYGAGFWSSGGGITGLTAAKINDLTLSGASSTAYTYPNATGDSWLVFDAGAGQVLPLGRVTMTALGTGFFDLPGTNIPEVEWSDDGSTWTPVIYQLVSPWSDNVPVSGYSQRYTIFSTYGAHRYFRIGYTAPRAPNTNIPITEAQFETINYDPNATHYQLWHSGSLVAVVDARDVPQGLDTYENLSLMDPPGPAIPGFVRYNVNVTIYAVTDTGIQSALGANYNASIDVPGLANLVPDSVAAATGSYLDSDGNWTTPSGGGGGGTWAVREVPSGSINGSNTTFTLAHTPTAGLESVYYNGLLQRITTDYTISGAVITMGFAPETGDSLVVTYPY